MGNWKEAQHLIRPALVFLAGSAVFLVARQLVVPPSFGQYGHYRGAVLDEVARQSPKFAGQQACADCHSDIVETRAKGRHRIVSCEACHGPLASHAQDPSAVVPKKPDPSPLCRRCHEADSAKPASFPQVATAEHSGGEKCESCHNPHQPKP